MARLLILALAFAATVLPLAHAQTFDGLGVLEGVSGTSSFAQGVSADGRVVVGVSTSTNRREAFRWTAATGMIGLGDLQGGVFSSSASATSADGSVVVGSGTTGDVASEAFRWTEATGLVALGDLDGGPLSSTAAALSADGAMVVGTGESSAGGEAFRWTEATGLVALGDLPGGAFSSTGVAVSADGAMVAGSGSSDLGFEPVLWTPGAGLESLGTRSGSPFEGQATGISADGAVVVGTLTGGPTRQGFRWSAAGGLVPLASLDETSTGTDARSVSGDGAVVVGNDALPEDGLVATVWALDGTVRSVQDLLTTDYGIDLGGWALRLATGVNEDGSVIVGWGVNPSGQIEAWRAELPPFVSTEQAAERRGPRVTVSPSVTRSQARVRVDLSTPGATSVDVLDLLGRSVRRVHDGPLGTGTHRFPVDTTRLPAGRYLVRVMAAGQVRSAPLTVIR